MKAQPDQGRRAVQRSRVAGRPAGCRTAGEEGRRRGRVNHIHPPTPKKKSGRTNTMAKLSTDELLDAFKELTLLELSEFVKKFEETFDVTAAAPVAVAAAPVPPLARPPRPPRSSRSSTSSSRPPVRRRSASSRSSARSSPASASRRPRISSTALPSRCSRRSPRRPPRRPRPSSRPPARRSPSSSIVAPSAEPTNKYCGADLANGSAPQSFCCRCWSEPRCDLRQVSPNRRRKLQ